MDKDLEDLLFILYRLNISHSKYINMFRKTGHSTRKANGYFLGKNSKRPVQLRMPGAEGSSREEEFRHRSILEGIKNNRFKMVYIGGPGYPAILEQIYAPPPVIFVSGPGEINGFNIAVVGSRKCTRYGKEAASYISRSLSEMGITIVSGLALGIDSIAHRESVKHKGGSIAVMGNGPDIIYPHENTGLHGRITGNGAVITEFSPGTPPLRQNFPVRNRIISGISRGVIIVEAGRRSGAMITGEIALEQDREVFAVPGSIFSSSSRGCHKLIKNGAKLVDDIDDILEEFQELFKPIKKREKPTGKSINHS